MNDKTCNNFGKNCNYKLLRQIINNCVYAGYCDYQAPKNSTPPVYNCDDNKNIL